MGRGVERPEQSKTLSDLVLLRNKESATKGVIAGVVLCVGRSVFFLPDAHHQQQLWRRCYLSVATWLILPVVICLSQRLSHACLSTSRIKAKPRMAH